MGDLNTNSKEYGILSNWFFFLKIWLKVFPIGVLWFVLMAIFNVFTVYFLVQIPRIVLSAIEANMDISQTIIDVSINSFLMLIFAVLAGALISPVMALGSRPMYYLYSVPVNKKIFSMSYQDLINPEIQNKITKIKNFIIMGDGNKIHLFGMMSSSLLTAFIGMILFSPAIFSVDVILLIIIISSGFFSFLFGFYESKYSKKNMNDRSESEKKEQYLIKVTGDPAYSKDIRIYSMIPWMKKRFLKHHYEHFSYIKKEIRVKSIGGFIKSLFIYARDVFAYIYLAYKLMEGSILISDFVFLIAVIKNFSIWMDMLVTEAKNLVTFSVYIEQFRDLLDTETPNSTVYDAKKAGKSGLIGDEVNIEFKNVSFKYPSSDKWILKDFNLKIEGGKNLGIVGMNGAGKTTIVFLMLGLLDPTEGEILVDGLNVREFNRDEYFGIFAPVFQDLSVFPETIAVNISGDKKYDNEKLEKVIKESGLDKVIDKLDEREQTLLYRTSSDKAIDLSGGQTQKMFLARALYKDGKVLVLDEPTSALDPLAESQLYEEYSKLTLKKTSIFISHRLASSKFCDRIILLESGKIVEDGTHNSLIELNGKYKEMFDIQSKYYKEQAV